LTKWNAAQFLEASLLLSTYHKNKTDKGAFRQSYLLAGVPMVIAYVVLDVSLGSDILL